MPVGAIIGAAGAIGGSLIGSSSQRRATDRAVQSSERTAQMNNALARDVYNSNSALLNPYVTRGNQAGSAINELLGLGGAANTNTPPAPSIPTGQPGGYQPGTGGPMNPVSLGMAGPLGGFNTNVQARMSGGLPHADGPGGSWGGGTPAMTGGPMTGTGGPMQTGTAGPMQPQQTGSATSAFDNFLNSAGARYQLDEGYKAVNQGYAARGALQSGAAMKALQDRGQQTMLNNYFMPYMGLLANQQGVGLSGASAVAGVGQNYVNNVSANNNNAGTAAANGALMNGAINSNMWSNIGGALGGLASSYGRGG